MSFTNIDSWPLHMALLYTGGSIIFIIVNIALLFYRSCGFLDRILAALPNSPSAVELRCFQRRGIGSRMHAMTMLSGILLYKRPFLKDGDLCPEDVKKLPKGTDFIIRLDFILGSIAMLWMISVAVLVKIREGAPL